MTYSQSLTRDQIRRYDQIAMELGIPGPVLMENAARGAVEILLRLGLNGPVSIVCGKGNNGGDGFVMARWLHALERPVSVELWANPEELTGDAAIAFAPLAKLGVRIHRAGDDTLSRLLGSQWVVDALLGTGAKGEVRPPFDQAISQINESGRSVLAVDLPSGLDCDLGSPLSEAGPVVRADHTVTFVARKRGFDHPESVAWTGTVHVVSLGVGYLDLES